MGWPKHYAIWGLSIGLGLVPWTGRADPLSLSASQVVERLIERGEQIQETFKDRHLSYFKRATVETLSQDGTVKEREEKLYDVLCKEGRVRMTLLEFNGQDIKFAHESDADQAARKRDKNGELKPPKGEERPLVLTKEMLERYEFELVDTNSVAERGSYILKFKPKPGLKDDNLIDRFLNRLEGKIWIDQRDYEVARAEIQLGAPVAIFGGLIGAVNQLSYTLERVPVTPNLWFNRASRGEFEMRKLLVSRHYRTESEWKLAE